MKRKLWFAVLAVLLWSPMAMAANSVVVQTKSVALNATGVTIGIFLANDVALTNYVIPLELRSTGGGAFITNMKRSYPSGTRLDGKIADISIINWYDGDTVGTCKGGLAGGYTGIINADQDVFYPVVSSPEAVFFTRGKVFGASLPIGSDGANPQMLLTVDVNGSNGTFEIDTTCTDPANHIVFASPAKITPAFTKGVITVGTPVVNHPPVARDTSWATNQDTPKAVAYLPASDADAGQVLTYAIVSAPSHGILSGFNAATGAFTYTPTGGYTGPDVLTFSACDNGAPLMCDTGTVSITVSPVNHAPVAVADAYNTNEDTPLIVTAPGVLSNDTDVDGNPLTAEKVTDPSHGAVTLNADGSFTYTPAANYNGPDAFTYKAKDATLYSNIVTVSITVNPVNDAPVAVNNSYNTNEDTPLIVVAPGVLTNDTDVEGDPLTAEKVTDPSHGTLALNADGSFTYTPAANYNGPDAFTYKAKDAALYSNIVTVSITVSPVNDAPVAVDDSYNTNEDTPLIVAAPGVLSNDTDVDGNPLTAEKVTDPSHGAVTLNANGSFTYTPAANYNGPDAFTYKAKDAALYSNIVTVSITINPVNDAPVAVNDSYNTDEETPLVIVAPGVLTNDTDVEGDPLTAVKVTDPSHGAVTLNSDGSFTYIPVANYSGPDAFTYKASDGITQGNMATVSITVNPVNDAPVAVDNSYNTNQDTPLNVVAPGVLGNDTDVDGNPLTAELVSDVNHGALVLSSNGSFLYTPGAGYNGLDTFTYKAKDAVLYSNIATVTINVSFVNSPPVLDPIGPKSVNEGILLTFPVAAHDFDGDAGITLSLESTPAGAVLTDNGSGSGTFDWTPSCAQGGSVYNVKFIASDGDLADTETVAITVNDLPEFLVASPESVVINYQMGDPAPDPVPIDLTDPGCRGQFPWQAISSQPWLFATPDTGTTPSTVLVSIDPSGLSEGPHEATLTIGPRAAAKSAVVGVVVVVHLSISAAPHDSVWVTSGAGELGDTVAVDVNFCNNHIATGISVGLKYSSFNVHPIGYSFVGSRVESLDIVSADTNSAARTICLVALPLTPDHWIPEGCGKLATLYFVVDSIPRCPDPDSTMIDSFTVGVGCELMLTDTTLAAVYPSFAPGAIHVICPGRICGVVSDTGGNPLSSAVVQVWSSYPDGEILGSQTTGADGHFCIIGLDREGTFDLRVYRLGYCTQVVNGVNPSDFGLITVQLEPVPAIIGTPSVAFYSSANARISGVPLMLGDVITAVDDDGVVCGKTVVEAPGAYLIAVVGDDIGTVGVDEGAKTGEQITFYLNCTCPILVPTPWADKARTEFDADFDCAQRQLQIPLCDSWTLFSFNVVPSNPSREAILSSISGQYQSVFTFVCPDDYQTWNAGFDPNSLDAMDPFHGYWLKPSGPGVGPIVLSGAPMAPNTPLNLCLGWNLISYLPDFPDTFTHALNSIDGEYVRVFGYECASQDAWKTWDANRPADLNDLGCMKPMRGYWVKTNTNTTLTYPIGGYQCNEGGPSLSKPVNLLTRVTPTPWVTDFWSAAPMSATGLRAGDHLTARTQAGVICGECLVGPKGSFLIHVYGDDPTTKDRVEGAAAGEVLRFEVNDAPAAVEAGSTVWSERESTELTVAVAKSSPVPSGYALLQNYPNPFNPSTVIKFRLPVAADAKLTIYNVLGQTVRTLFSGSLSEGDHSFEWNGQNESGQVVQSGIYFYRLDTPAWSDVKKMTFLK